MDRVGSHYISRWEFKRYTVFETMRVIKRKRMIVFRGNYLVTFEWVGQAKGKNNVGMTI